MKPIKLTQSSIAKAKDAIIKQLDNLKLQDTKVNFTYDFAEVLKEQLNNEIKKPIVYMMANTYLKMLEYVLRCDTEIAWHGTVRRGEGAKSHIFYIKDVYLYPQKIAAATVQVDDDKYTQWSDKQDADSFNNRRFQGHSHVNMGTFYSGTDETNKNAFLQDLLDDDYYIFLVTNKRQEHNFEIYDLAQNIIFENKDIDFRVYLTENELLESIPDEISNYCTKQTYQSSPATYNSYSGYSGYNGLGSTKSSWPGLGKSYNDNDNYYKGSSKVHKIPIKIKRHVVLMNRAGRNFEKEYPEFEGDIIDIRFNGQDYNVFVPFTPLRTSDIANLRKDGWHVREMPVPDEYNI